MKSNETLKPVSCIFVYLYSYFQCNCTINYQKIVTIICLMCQKDNNPSKEQTTAQGRATVATRTTATHTHTPDATPSRDGIFALALLSALGATVVERLHTDCTRGCGLCASSQNSILAAHPLRWHCACHSRAAPLNRYLQFVLPTTK